jgi:hypothetical protein
VIARFDSERQALAMMDHAKIARVFDAGTTTSIQAYRRTLAACVWSMTRAVFPTRRNER